MPETHLRTELEVGGPSGRRKALTRLSHLFCEIALRVELVGCHDGEPQKLLMAQEQMGDALGLSPVSVNRMIKQIESSGLIVLDKRTVTLRDAPQLGKVADFR